MMVHSFYGDVAIIAGLNAAVVHYEVMTICYFCKGSGGSIEFKDEDGSTFVKISAKSLSKKIKFLSEKQISSALKKLVEIGFIHSKELNDSKMDHTLWYSAVEL